MVWDLGCWLRGFGVLGVLELQSLGFRVSDFGVAKASKQRMCQYRM